MSKMSSVFTVFRKKRFQIIVFQYCENSKPSFFVFKIGNSPKYDGLWMTKP
jgi:hypothetical protein